MGDDLIKLEERARQSPKSVRFGDLVKLCTHYFGEPRTNQGGSHMVYKTPWPGNPRVNIQDGKDMAKPYQVKQVLEAIDKMKEAGNAS